MDYGTYRTGPEIAYGGPVAQAHAWVQCQPNLYDWNEECRCSAETKIQEKNGYASSNYEQVFACLRHVPVVYKNEMVICKTSLARSKFLALIYPKFTKTYHPFYGVVQVPALQWANLTQSLLLSRYDVMQCLIMRRRALSSCSQAGSMAVEFARKNRCQVA